jgi:alanine racemase
MHTRPVWVEISRKNLIGNYRELRRLAGASGDPDSEAEILAVVKANAYGHDMTTCARIVLAAGAKWIGITSVEEGIEARAVSPVANILVMSGPWNGEAEAAIEHRLTPVVWETFHLDMLESAARRFELPPQSVPVHLEIDTGMSRQGVQTSGSMLAEMLERFHAASSLQLEGVATHFSAPEVLDGPETAEQTARFLAAIQSVASLGLRPAWIHAGNSATLLPGDPFPRVLREAAVKLGAKLMLRPGLSLYGYAPRFTEAGHAALKDLPPAKLSPVLAWKSRVTSIREITAGESAGYNSTFRAVRTTRLALLPMGYADGLSRLLSNRGAALVRGQRAPIAGRVSMDQTILDVTGIPEVAIADEAVMIGTQGEESISAYDLADLTGTIPYEVLCNISSRVPRLLVD